MLAVPSPAAAVAIPARIGVGVGFEVAWVRGVAVGPGLGRLLAPEAGAAVLVLGEGVGYALPRSAHGDRGRENQDRETKNNSAISRASTSAETGTRIFGASGRAFIDDGSDGVEDFIGYGSGFDKVRADGVDKLDDCEGVARR